MSEPEVLSFPEADRLTLEAAVNAAILKRTKLAEELREGAAASVTDEARDSETARLFQTFLELGYLVASADGFAPEERASLAQLLETVTGGAIEESTLDEHFQDLDQGVAMLGRQHRLAAGAAALEGERAAEEAIVLVTLIALADGVLAKAEYDVIAGLGEHAGVGPERVKALVDQAGDHVKEALQ